MKYNTHQLKDTKLLRIKCLAVFLLFCSMAVSSFGEDGILEFTQLEYVHSFESTERSNSGPFEQDIAGNIYLSGTFSGVLDADPGEGVYELEFGQGNGSGTRSFE